MVYDLYSMKEGQPILDFEQHVTTSFKVIGEETVFTVERLLDTNDT